MNPTLETLNPYRPCLILAHADCAYATAAARVFRREGWDVYNARSGPEARRLARMLRPSLVVLGTDLPEESGWLICDKLTRESPTARVILVAVEPDRPSEQFARFVGAAALVDRNAGPTALLHEAEQAVLAVA
ncbi:MAG TPA: response regulator [Gemmataceae bacterium]|jgi:DNA-binding response OmpR family regulator|nr:response regulator [Gemmataceae bacterium]